MTTELDKQTLLVALEEERSYLMYGDDAKSDRLYELSLKVCKCKDTSSEEFDELTHAVEFETQPG